MLKRRLPLVLIGIVGLSLVALLALRREGRGGGYLTAMADKGDVSDVVGATGVLQAVTTVQVGSQVSGTISSLGADFNSVVHKDQVVLRLDPALFEAKVAQMKANLISSKATVEHSKAALDDAKQKFERSKELAAANLLPASDLETAQANYESAVATLHANESAVTQADAALNQAVLDLDHSIIRTPIDGVVLARNVDVGQTVAASFQAPTLFVIANDLTQMQVNASIDEADIGRIHNGQKVTFRVDAYPDQVFTGLVAQVRLQPITTQNVVTYNTLITVSNPDLKLMPGMTATVSAIIESHEGVVRVPTAALRYRPVGFEEKVKLDRPAPEASAPPRRADGQSQRGAPHRPPRDSQSAAPSERGAGSSATGEGRPKPARTGLVFVLGDDGRPKPTPVQLGISDGRFSEVASGLEPGARIVVGDSESRGSSPKPGASPSTNPFSPQRFQPRTR